jgi:hypothetical protein
VSLNSSAWRAAASKSALASYVRTSRRSWLRVPGEQGERDVRFLQGTSSGT